MSAAKRSRLEHYLQQALAYDDLEEEPLRRAPKLRVEELRPMAFATVGVCVRADLTLRPPAETKRPAVSVARGRLMFPYIHRRRARRARRKWAL